MKAICPICKVKGFVQVRGKNVMIQHYEGFRNNKRMYRYHRVPYAFFEQLELQVNASKTVQVKNYEISFNIEKSPSVAGGVGFEPTTKWRYHPQLPFFGRE